MGYVLLRVCSWLSKPGEADLGFRLEAFRPIRLVTDFTCSGSATSSGGYLAQHIFPSSNAAEEQPTRPVLDLRLLTP